MDALSASFGDLGSGFRGEIFLPADSGYDTARAVWNAMIDRRPALIARCRSTVRVRMGCPSRSGAGRTTSQATPWAMAR